MQFSVAEWSGTEAWDASMSSRIEEATVKAPVLCSSSSERAIEVIRKFGFCIVESEACGLDPASVATRHDELHEFGEALGIVLKQSPRDEPVEDIKDFSDVDSVKDDRGYRSGGEMLPHSDPPTLIILHCVQAAKSGGESQIVNVASIHQGMEATKPGLAKELFVPLPNWRVEGQNGVPYENANPIDQPVLAYSKSNGGNGGNGNGEEGQKEDKGVLSCYLYRPFLDKACEEKGFKLSPMQKEALDLFQQQSLSEELTLRLTLQPGQTIILLNRCVLHARTDFEDHSEINMRRHLLRMWVDAPSAFPVFPAHEIGCLFLPVGETPTRVYERKVERAAAAGGSSAEVAK